MSRRIPPRPSGRFKAVRDLSDLSRITTDEGHLFVFSKCFQEDDGSFYVAHWELSTN